MNLYCTKEPADACCVGCHQEVQVYYVLTYPNRGAISVIKRYEPHQANCAALQRLLQGIHRAHQE